MKSNQKKQSKSKSHIPLRLNILFAGVFACFAMLILRLGYLQIVSGEEFEAEVARTETTLATGNVPRGEIYDVNHRKLVGNTAVQTITYTRGQGVASEDMAKIAVDLASFIDMPHKVRVGDEKEFDITPRDLQDFWLVLNEEKLNERLTDKEKEQSGPKFYQTQISKVTDEDIAGLSNVEKEAAAIFKKMNGAYALTTINIKNDGVTDKEIALVSENLHMLPGVDTGTDWIRNYPQEGMLKSILGEVTTEEKGVPESQLSTYLAKGYARNDRVGNSQLEKEYEPVLSGSKSKSETQTNNSGDIIETIEQYAGEKGDNLVLSIDMDYQEILEKIAIEALGNRQGQNNSIYITAADPQTGEVLALAGKEYNPKTGKIQDAALHNINQSFEMGSAVKGATILAGYMDGALTYEDNVIVDAPLKLKSTPSISSVFNRSGSVAVNDIKALEVSSNVYMAKLVLRMGGQDNVTQNGSVSINIDQTLDKLRGYFHQFGLGVETGIDLPGEATGYVGPNPNGGSPMFYGFGQYDTYTPIQLLQYVSTIANGGNRIALRLVDEIWSTGEDGNLGAISTQLEPKVLNTINVEEKALERVQQGFYQVIHGANGSARSRFVGAEYEAAGKTGTAETRYNGEDVINKTFVAYAPYDDPEIAITVVVPYLPLNNTNYENTIVARKALDAYFKVGEFKNTAPEDVEIESESSSADSE
ncbi:Cell division protein FtsI/penicillin-binding protein 2 [Desemzia incerta]|uniref:Cell division protein FtsI/penicillin-binding protein 2 n=1 Tax=Desemzia incerta TaxID=82801 RepID=A0A1I5YH09_9LACT|nr:penicillin-binding protein 2 [Desemzia incerta]SFQ43488.1 Cell division protein FtsI/penicillin-binding protein 2 [Desemzia incerta]